MFALDIFLGSDMTNTFIEFQKIFVVIVFLNSDLYCLLFCSVYPQTQTKFNT